MHHTNQSYQKKIAFLVENREDVRIREIIMACDNIGGLIHACLENMHLDHGSELSVRLNNLAKSARNIHNSYDYVNSYLDIINIPVNSIVNLSDQHIACIHFLRDFENFIKFLEKTANNYNNYIKSLDMNGSDKKEILAKARSDENIIIRMIFHEELNNKHGSKFVDEFGRHKNTIMNLIDRPVLTSDERKCIRVVIDGFLNCQLNISHAHEKEKKQTLFSPVKKLGRVQREAMDSILNILRALSTPEAIENFLIDAHKNLQIKDGATNPIVILYNNSKTTDVDRDLIKKFVEESRHEFVKVNALKL